MHDNRGRRAVSSGCEHANRVMMKFGKRTGKGESRIKKGSRRRGGFKPFRKSGSGGKANMANENSDPYDQAYWRKGKGKKGKKGKSKVAPHMTMAKEKADMTKENPKRSQALQTNQRSALPRSRLRQKQ